MRGLIGSRRVPSTSYMVSTYPPYLDQGLIQTVSTVSGPGYSGYTMYCISLYLDRGLIQSGYSGYNTYLTVFTM